MSISDAMRRRLAAFKERDAAWLAKQPHVFYPDDGTVDVNYMGRSGSAQQFGIMLQPNKSYVHVTPMNSMGPAQNAFLQIPVEALPEVIAVLQSFIPEVADSAQQESQYVRCQSCEHVSDVDDFTPTDGNPSPLVCPECLSTNAFHMTDAEAAEHEKNLLS